MRHAILLLVALAAPGIATAQTYPNPTGKPVIDAANVIPNADEAALNDKLLTIYAQTKHQVAVLTIPTLNGQDVREYSIGAARHYGFGNRERSDGVLWTISPRDRADNIEVGDGLQGVLTDAKSSQIRRETVLPLFKRGDLVGGINAGVDRIAAIVAEEPVTAVQVAATEQRRSDETGSILWTILLSIAGVVVGVAGVALWLNNRDAKRRAAAEQAEKAREVALMIERDRQRGRETARAEREAAERKARREGEKTVREYREFQESRAREPVDFATRHARMVEADRRRERDRAAAQAAAEAAALAEAAAATKRAKKSSSSSSSRYSSSSDDDDRRSSSYGGFGGFGGFGGGSSSSDSGSSFSGDSGSYSGGGDGGSWD